MSKKIRKPKGKPPQRKKQQFQKIESNLVADIIPDDKFIIGDKQFMDMMYINIKESYSEEQANAFLANPEFNGWKEHTNTIQRGLVNRVLINKLLVHRASNKVSVVDAIYCLMPDGDNESWMNVFKMVILPFLNENKVKL